MCCTRSGTSSRSWTASSRGCRTSVTVAVRQPPLGACGRCGSSVTLVALLAPGVAPVVVAVLLPEPGLVALQQGQPVDPLGSLPEVRVGPEHPPRPAVLDRQRSAVVLPHDPRL